MDRYHSVQVVRTICLLSMITTILRPDAAIADVRYSGFVKSNNQPVSGARVELSGSPLFAVSTSNGVFAITGNPSGISPVAPLQPQVPRLRLAYRSGAIVAQGVHGNGVRVLIYDMAGKIVASASGKNAASCALPHSSAMHVIRATSGSLIISGRVMTLDGCGRSAFVAIDSRDVFGGASRALEKTMLFSGSSLSYLAATKAGFFPGYAAVMGDTGSAITIILNDSAAMKALLPYQNPTLSPYVRAADLVSRMTTQEKTAQMSFDAPAISRLGIRAYVYWNEALHGVARMNAWTQMTATSFPQAIGMAAMWDTKLMYRIGTAIAEEARAIPAPWGGPKGLTYWCPNINIFRDPRWGRGQETYGEDPYLTSRLAVAFVTGMQGDDPRYLRVVATPKHFAVFSGPGNGGAGTVSERDLRQTYLPAFKACVKEAHAASIMCSYNSPNGTPSCRNTYLLQQILRAEWGFDGFVTSDCGAALTFASGCDLSCQGTPDNPVVTVMDSALIRIFADRIRLGEFDPSAMVPYASIPQSVNECPAHRELARMAALKSMVLLKNDGGVLPLRKDRKVAVVGPHADWADVYLGNYNGKPTYKTTILAGIRTKVAAANVGYEKGCDVTATIDGGYTRAESLARWADVVVATGGLRSESVGDALEREGGDRTNLNFPAVQQELIRVLSRTGKPLVLVFINGSPISDPIANDSADAVVEAWYPGQAGDAVADVLFGDYNPAGRLPVTFYASVNQCPPMDDYDMTKGRTYRYLTQQPLYWFGHGLSYTTFSYSNLSVSPGAPSTFDTLTVSATVTNTGARAGDEVVQLYISDQAASVVVPIRELKGFARVPLAAGESKQVSFRVMPYQLSLINASNKRVIEPGAFSLSLGGGQPNPQNPSNVLTGSFTMGGSEREFDK